ncbi:hypothetical protein ZIOFF_037955 [Zingiber officinale]|uniref:Uncharacterized protein n=1 Tax=Zingiber officinale TaxID=94328 RepID=A0A8J5GC81_ZINOF|nr:hypothetical protein ZIOFF_037955 [Zingiber officinale]
MPSHLSKNTHSVHILLDYCDTEKLHKITNVIALIATVYRATGTVHGSFGFVNVTDFKGAKVRFSAIDNDTIPIDATFNQNSELVLAVKDLEGMLEQRHKETLCAKCSKMEMKDIVDLDVKATKFENGPHICRNLNVKQQIPKTISVRDNEEEYASVALINERDDMKTAYSLESKIIDLNNEAELYRKNWEKLEMQMENHDATTKLEQMQLREQLSMQYECFCTFIHYQ